MKHYALAFSLLFLTSMASAQRVVVSAPVMEGKKTYLMNVDAIDKAAFVWAVSTLTGGQIGFWTDVPSIRMGDPRKGILSVMMPQGGVTWIVMTWGRGMQVLKTDALPAPAKRF